jgi:hypothetical protein
MMFSKRPARIALIGILLLISATFLLYGVIQQGFHSNIEGFELVPLEINPITQKPINGYYQVDDTHMAIIPYGFGIDPNNPKKIIPITKVGASMLKPTYKPGIPALGEPVPDGFYFIADSSLAILPPNMKPDVREIKFSGTPVKYEIYYNHGYVSETEYYKQQYAPANIPNTLPDGLYFTDSSKTKVSFLPEGKIADKTKGYGMLVNPSLNLTTTAFNYATSNYRDIGRNLDVQFHDNEETIKAANAVDYGDVKVIDQCGNIVILPRPKIQETVTYYKPGEFPFGASTYVPNYEDSVYLGSVGYRTQFRKKLCENY